MRKNRILIVTDKDEPSVARVIDLLQKMNELPCRLDVGIIADLQSKIHLCMKDGVFTGHIQCADNTEVEMDAVKSVWVRRPQAVSVSETREAIEKQFIEDEFTSSLWSLYTCLDSVYWMNHPLHARHLLEHNKLFQLKLAVSADLIIPDTLVTNDAVKLIAFCERHGKSIAVKAVRSRIFQEDGGSATGIYTNKVSLDYLKTHADDIGVAPIMAQEYIPKKLELRITIIGQDVLTCAIHSQDSERTKDDWRRYDFENVKHERYKLPDNVILQLLEFMRKCHLSFGAVDMILTPDGRYVFLEVNPSGQFGWIENLTGLPISQSIANTLAKGG